MSSKKKHMERSRRSHHDPKPFAQFEARANMKAYHEAERITLLERVKRLFHKAA